MTEFYTDPLVTLLHGDCLEVLPTLEADSVDAVVTDPPYALTSVGVLQMKLNPSRKDGGLNAVRTTGGFMGKTWDAPADGTPRGFQAWCEQWGREALRVTKPGGYLLAFGGTRTHHRLVCALEDAGWIIRDELDWVYASGFPKGTANLKPAHEPIVLARKPGPLRPLGIDATRIPTPGETPKGSGNRNGEGTAYHLKDWVSRNGGNETPAAGRWPSNVLLSDPELFDQPNPYVVGSGVTAGGSGPASGPTLTGESTSNSRGKFNGVEETPFYGDSGGYSRFFIIPKADRAERERGLAGRTENIRITHPRPCPVSQGITGHCTCSILVQSKEDGRTTMDGGEFTADGRTASSVNHAAPRANVHPTVKPIDLMRHLVRLVTPPGGVVLDPFLGSGTTCLAASEEGFRSVGIERELEYLEITKGRLLATPMGLGLDVPVVGRRDLGKQRGNKDEEGAADIGIEPEPRVDIRVLPARGAATLGVGGSVHSGCHALSGARGRGTEGLHVRCALS